LKLKFCFVIACISSFHLFAADVTNTRIKQLMIDRNHGEKLFIDLENKQQDGIIT